MDIMVEKIVVLFDGTAFNSFTEVVENMIWYKCIGHIHDYEFYNNVSSWVLRREKKNNETFYW